MTISEWHQERMQLLRQLSLMHQALWSANVVGHEQLDVLAADKVCWI